MKRLAMALLVSMTVLFASSCATVETVQQSKGDVLNDAQRLEQHDDYVPWWKFNF